MRSLIQKKKLGIEAPAGTGKTLVLLLKIMYIVKAESDFNVLLLAPSPHNIQCKQFLRRNGVDVHLTDAAFPMPASDLNDREHPSQPKVRVVDLGEFQEKCQKNIKSNSAISLREHVFVDDLQWTKLQTTLECLSEICDMHDPEINVWMAFDPVQGYGGAMHDDFKTIFNGAAICTLSEVLRNARPILEAAHVQYSNYASYYGHIVPFHKSGHSINGPLIECFGLYKSPKSNISIQKQYLKETMQKIFSEWLEVPTTILYFDESEFEVCSSVLHDLGKKVIDIATFYEQQNKLNPLQVVCDSYTKTGSFEMPLVVCVGKGTGVNYTTTTRARSKLIHINLASESHAPEGLKKEYPNARLAFTDPSQYEFW